MVDVKLSRRCPVLGCSKIERVLRDNPIKPSSIDLSVVRSFGADPAAWRNHDAVALIEDGARLPALLVDQGADDAFLAGQLRPELLTAACDAAGVPSNPAAAPGL